MKCRNFIYSAGLWYAPEWPMGTMLSPEELGQKRFHPPDRVHESTPSCLYHHSCWTPKPSLYDQYLKSPRADSDQSLMHGDRADSRLRRARKLR